MVDLIWRLPNIAHTIGNKAAGRKKRKEELITVVRLIDNVKKIAIHIIPSKEAIAILPRSCLDIVESCGIYFQPKRQSMENADIILSVVNVSGEISWIIVLEKNHTPPKKSPDNIIYHTPIYCLMISIYSYMALLLTKKAQSSNEG